MKLVDLRNVIEKDCEVGLLDEAESDLPVVDTWNNWINGGLKTLDVEIKSIRAEAYLILVLRI